MEGDWRGGNTEEERTSGRNEEAKNGWFRRH